MESGCLKARGSLWLEPAGRQAGRQGGREAGRSNVKGFSWNILPPAAPVVRGTHTNLTAPLAKSSREQALDRDKLDI